ncbi:MAG TPA: phosphoenolpyruvate carboxylase [Steroidobacteraceae bacterium]|nr:phosphoenolpyruvate carboxylase [Steroidobacteraceae bacterium]
MMRGLAMHRHDIEFAPKDAALREDVHALGALVGEIIREQGGQELFRVVEGDRVAAIARREGEPGGADELINRTRDRPTALARDLVRAFATWFQVVNLAEKVHRIRRRRQYFISQNAPQPQGVGDSLLRLKQQGLTLEQVLDLIRSMRIEPVFTAHPIESTRRTILRKQQRIAQLMMMRLDPTLTPQELASVWGRIRTEITTAWQTEEHPRLRLTVADEREHVLFFLTEIIYRIVPAFYEEIETSLRSVFGAAAEAVDLPCILDFGSWVGGDMDGNPEVHAKTIRETLARHQQLIISNYFSEVQGLAAKLSQSASRVGVSAPLQQRIEEYAALLPAAQATTPARHDRMAYRVFLAQVAERLRNTYESGPNHYDNAAQFLADIDLVAASLLANRGRHAGYHGVRRLQLRIRTFGFHLATLDVRQHTDVHHEVLSQGLGDEQWFARGPEERLARLRDALERDQGPLDALDAVGRRTLWVFEAIMQCRHKYGRLALGDYIVSGATGSDDALAVLLLARWAEAIDRRSGEVPLDIVPLFESTQALEQCGAVMRRLLDEPVYRRHLEARGNQQVVLIGYSDSNKMAGIAAARWATHRAQSELVRVMAGTGVTLTVFHGRGGSLSRGGGRIDALVRSAPPGAVTGRLLVTEQGDVINQNYGLRPVAMRTLERAFNAMGLTMAKHESPEDPRYLEVMQTLADTSRAAYARLVTDDPAFFEYFRQATPVDAIEKMQVGSRTAGRGERTDFESLRAVPWVFAWTQSRHMLPGWFGVGSGLQAVLERHGREVLEKMRSGWFFFASFLDDVEAMLARTDLGIAAFYNELAEARLQGYFAQIRSEFELSCRLILQLKGTTQLLDGDRTLQRSILLRNPYVDPMHLMQVDLLKRWRRSERRDNEQFQALLASISGISQGLHSSG